MTVTDGSSTKWVSPTFSTNSAPLSHHGHLSWIPSWKSFTPKESPFTTLHTAFNVLSCIQTSLLPSNLHNLLGTCCTTISLVPYICAIKLFNFIFFRCDLRIISDANLFYIETILEHHNLLGCFSEINTNPTFVDEKGCLHVTPFHDSTTLPPHACQLCPPNVCQVYTALSNLYWCLLR
jgi:hypothetical protein